MNDWLLHGLGWEKPIASFTPIVPEKRSGKTESGSFSWTHFSIPRMDLSSRASLLLVQGMKLQKLFDDTVLLECLKQNEYCAHPGPFLLVKGSYRPFDSPPMLREVVLARLEELPSSISETDAIGVIVQAVLST